jgi:energy-coupling factor transporter transmembrane protein EcfT
MFMSATVLLVAVLVFKGEIRWRDYAISVPSATMCLSFLMLLMTCKPDFYTAYGKLPNQITFLWNFVGACLLTFGSPFDTTGNG